jgi:uncharacterized protein YbjT (DUF2867 family)
VRGAEVIVHCAGSSKGDEQKTRTLVSAAKDTRHIVLISVVGADRIPQVGAIDRAFFGHVGMKLATERVVEQSGLVPDLAGPKIYTVAELVKNYLSAVGKRRPLVPVHIPGQAARALRAGANLAPDRAVGKRTWEEFLADRI